MKVYLDNAATTSVDKDVYRVMKPYFLNKYGNASEPHLMGNQAREAIEKARENIANLIKSKPEEIIFARCKRPMAHDENIIIDKMY